MLNLKTARQKLGLSQKQMADKMGFTDQAYISRIESGKYNLSRSSQKLLEMIIQQELRGNKKYNPNAKFIFEFTPYFKNGTADFPGFKITGTLKQIRGQWQREKKNHSTNEVFARIIKDDEILEKGSPSKCLLYLEEITHN